MRWGFYDPEGSFWSRVDRSGGMDSCWPWQGAYDPNGYGAVKVGSRKRGTHVYAWELANGRSRKKGFDVCHTCNNRFCCNPKHLYEGTRLQNVHDALAAGTHHVPKTPQFRVGLRGENAPCVNLREHEVLDIYRRACSRENYGDIAQDYEGVNRGTVKDIKNGRSWYWLTGATRKRH